MVAMEDSGWVQYSFKALSAVVRNLAQCQHGKAASQAISQLKFKPHTAIKDWLNNEEMEPLADHSWISLLLGIWITEESSRRLKLGLQLIIFIVDKSDDYFIDELFCL